MYPLKLRQFWHGKEAPRARQLEKYRSVVGAWAKLEYNRRLEAFIPWQEPTGLARSHREKRRREGAHCRRPAARHHVESNFLRDDVRRKIVQW